MTHITMTTRERFHKLATHHQIVPVVRKTLADGETALSTYRELTADRPSTFLLGSSDVRQS